MGGHAFYIEGTHLQGRANFSGGVKTFGGQMRPPRAGLLSDPDIPVAAIEPNRTPVLGVNRSHGDEGRCGPDRFPGTTDDDGRPDAPAHGTVQRFRGRGPTLARTAAFVRFPGLAIA